MSGVKSRKRRFCPQVTDRRCRPLAAGPGPCTGSEIPPERKELQALSGLHLSQSKHVSGPHPSCFVYFTPNLASCDLNACHTSHPRQQPPNRVLQSQVASLIQTHSFWLLFNHLSFSPRHARFILTNVSIETVPFLAATPCILTSNSRGTVMAMRPSSHPPVGAAAWCADERSSAVEIAQSEVEEFAYSARNEVEWLNEHMADIFSENHMYVSDASNLAHRR